MLKSINNVAIEHKWEKERGREGGEGGEEGKAMLRYAINCIQFNFIQRNSIQFIKRAFQPPN